MFSFGFYDSLNGDRKYSAEQMSSIFDGVICDGVYQNIGDFLTTISGVGMQVIVKTGRAWFNHTWSLNDSPLSLRISEADVIRTRIDAVVLEVDSRLESRTNAIKIVEGTPSTTPLKPTLQRDAGLYQYPLAYVTVKANVTAITSEDIEIMVGRDDTPFVMCPLTTVPIDDLFNKWQGEFDAWFEDLQEQLSGDVVTNLQKQIDSKVDIADKATASDLRNAVEGKWVDAKLAKNELMSVTNGTKVGDIVYSVTNLEEETNGKFIACDGRTVLLASYPDLDPSLLRFPTYLQLIGTTVLSSYNLSTSFYSHGKHLNIDNYIYAPSLVTNGAYKYVSICGVDLTTNTIFNYFININVAIRVSDSLILAVSANGGAYLNNDLTVNNNNSIYVKNISATQTFFLPIDNVGVFYINMYDADSSLGVVGTLGIIDTEGTATPIGSAVVSTLLPNNYSCFIGDSDASSILTSCDYTATCYPIKRKDNIIWMALLRDDYFSATCTQNESGVYELSSDTVSSEAIWVLNILEVDIANRSYVIRNIFDNELLKSDVVKHINDLIAKFGYFEGKIGVAKNATSSPNIFSTSFDDYVLFTITIYTAAIYIPAVHVCYNVFTNEYTICHAADLDASSGWTNNYVSTIPVQYFAKLRYWIYSKSKHSISYAPSMNDYYKYIAILDLNTWTISRPSVGYIMYQFSTKHGLSSSPYPIKYGDDYLVVCEVGINKKNIDVGIPAYTGYEYLYIKDGYVDNYCYVDSILPITNYFKTNELIADYPYFAYSSIPCNCTEHKGDLYYLDQSNLCVVRLGSERVMPIFKNGYMRVLPDTDDNTSD